ncbi:hypothetical protein [Natrinema pallidum]|uniref:hypothetical protein n=1 Tax=Natrinema pallidum TaxID=69527 RepID=UPI00126972EF|nr:hypothetical protein [Natrinema pallidum]
MGASTGATVLAALLTSSTIGGAVASIGFGTVYAYADNNWDGLSGDLDEQAQQLMEIIKEDIWQAEEGDSTGDAKSRR